MADKSKNNSKFKSSSILDDISALHNINKPKNSRATGSEYETLAAAFLEQNGHTIITRNYELNCCAICINGCVKLFVN